MEVHGWGRFPRAEADIHQARDARELREIIDRVAPGQSLVARGAGRSYGDSALADVLLGTSYLDSFIEFDRERGVLDCSAGVALADILQTCIPHGWMPPVLPGTRFVTLGGAIAADIHGKNHHLDGTFGTHLRSLSVLLASGELVQCSAAENAELFHATCAGMGLTGVITRACLQLSRLPGAMIQRQSIPVGNLEESMAVLEENRASPYSVAWLDCLATGPELGRGVVYLGEHTENGTLEFNQRLSLPVPFSTPAILLNRYTMRTFNSFVYGINKRGKHTRQVAFDRFFFPLDNIRHWNRLYGRRGFLQYQFVLPQRAAKTGMETVLGKLAASGKGSFLSVLKQFGPANQNLLSFPIAGYTLALDLKYDSGLLPLLDELDAIVTDHGGRIYLAKDARMSEAVFKRSYPNWEQFREIKQRCDPKSVFASLQSRRLGLSS